MAEDLYRQAVALIWPHVRLVGKPPSDAAMGDRDAALRDGIARLRSVLATAPQHWPSHWLLGKAYEALGRPEAEYESFRRAYQLQPDHPDVCRELMRVCLALGKGPEAVEVARRACGIRPEDPGLMANLGLALMVRGDIDEALAVTRKALSLAPDDEITRSLSQQVEDVRDGRAERPTRWADDD